jgi:2-succinyl-5-enolpyruvyl-6-hydroxy-3-cyclohexene-1-carboxylate synthase
MVSRNLVDQSALFLSSSLPIREINSFAVEDGPAVPVAANRGASGIDGVVASAVGYSRGFGMQVTLLIGDLALLHDLNSLALTRRLREPMTIVVLNNNGGGIFNLLPIARQHDVFERFFGTPHDLNFEHAATMFGLDYFHPETAEEFVPQYRAAQRGQRSAILEVTTDRGQTADIYRELKSRVIEALS